MLCTFQIHESYFLTPLRKHIYVSQLEVITALQEWKSNKSWCRSKILLFSIANLLGSSQTLEITKKYREKLRFLNYFWTGYLFETFDKDLYRWRLVNCTILITFLKKHISDMWVILKQIMINLMYFYLSKA